MAEDIATELQAMKALVETLEPLKPEVRSRVIEYVFKVLGIEPSQPVAPSSPPPGPPTLHSTLSRIHMPDVHMPTDILSFKEEKGPTTGTQMIAVVAYYLAHLANERQDFITVDDIQKYFVQGHFPMPGSKSQALINAKNAGYLDYVEPGKYRLNSVGYNLVAHRMPSDGAAGKSKKRATKTATRRAKKAKK